MKKRLAILALTGILLVAGGWLLAGKSAAACPGGCCSGPHDCPTPACCARK